MGIPARLMVLAAIISTVLLLEQGSSPVRPVPVSAEGVERTEFRHPPPSCEEIVNSPQWRDKSVTILKDVIGVLEYSNTSLSFPCNSGPDGLPGTPDDRCYTHDKDGNTVMDGIAYDRSAGGAWSGPPDSSITILTDVALVLAQSGHDCIAPP